MENVITLDTSRPEFDDLLELLFRVAELLDGYSESDDIRSLAEFFNVNRR